MYKGTLVYVVYCFLWYKNSRKRINVCLIYRISKYIIQNSRVQVLQDTLYSKKCPYAQITKEKTEPVF